MKKFEISRIAHGDHEFVAARDAEFRVFGLVNGFANVADRAAGEMLAYKAQEPLAEFYVARWAQDRSIVAGVARLIRYGIALGIDSFSTIRDAKAYVPPGGGTAATYLDPAWYEFFQKADPTLFAELATQAIVPRFRRWGAMEEIWAAMLEVCPQNGVRYWTVALTVPLFRVYKTMFPEALQAVGSVMPGYVGADSIPGLFDLDHPEVHAYARFVRRSCWRERGEIPEITEPAG